MATAYTNYLGSGDRIGCFRQTTTFATGQDMARLLDGLTASAAFWFNSQTVDGKSLEFAIVGSARVIDAFKIYKSSSTGTQSFKFQGWDGSTWTDLTTFNWPNASGATEFTFTNTTAYRRYRFLGVSGSVTTTNIYQIEFSTESASSYETDARASLITVTATGITSSAGTNVQSLVDGSDAKDTTHSWYPTGGQVVSPSMHIDFALSAARTFNAAKIRMSSSSPTDNGHWKWQGSNDGSTWTDVSDPFLWDFPGNSGATGVETGGFCQFAYAGSYSYYRLVGIDKITSSTPWYTEIHFDDGPAPTWPSSAVIASGHVDVLNKGAGSSIKVASSAAHALNQGPGSTTRVIAHAAHVLSTIFPAGELSGDTNAGVHHDVTQWGGSDVVDPLILETHFTDEDGFDAEINISVGNPFKLKFTDESEYRAVMTRNLSARFTDDGGFDAEMDSLPPPPLQTFMLVSGR